MDLALYKINIIIIIITDIVPAPVPYNPESHILNTLTVIPIPLFCCRHRPCTGALQPWESHLEHAGVRPHPDLRHPPPGLRLRLGLEAPQDGVPPPAPDLRSVARNPAVAAPRSLPAAASRGQSQGALRVRMESADDEPDRRREDIPAAGQAVVGDRTRYIYAAADGDVR